MNEQDYMTPEDLVKKFKNAFTLRTLKKWRKLRKGPAFVRICGRIRYRVDDVRAWEDSLRNAGKT